MKFTTFEKRRLVQHNELKWLLFCHCETSTGVINDLNRLTKIASRHHCLCFVDCMSTVGTDPIDVSKVAMATASSGKGFASVPGLAIIFSNIPIQTRNDIPIYLDLHHYLQKKGVPFTISSNLVSALYTSIQQKLQINQFELLQEYGERLFNRLSSQNLVPYSDPQSKVFTIVHHDNSRKDFIDKMNYKQILFSCESEYLVKSNWCQLATLGYYTKHDLDYVLQALG